MRRPPAMRGRIGWLGHDPGLYPELTAAENLRFFAALHGVADPDARVAEALDRARLRDRAGDPVGSFSRGMRQRDRPRARADRRAALVLLDEPFTGLDEVSSQLLLARLAALRDGGAIVLLSTHDPARIEGLLDAAVVLRGGRLVAHLPAGPAASPRPSRRRRTVERRRAAQDAADPRRCAPTRAAPRDRASVRRPASRGRARRRRDRRRVPARRRPRRAQGRARRAAQPRAGADDAVLRRGGGARLRVRVRRRQPGAARRPGRHPLGHDAVRRHAGAGAGVRSRAGAPDARGAALGAGRPRRDLRRARCSAWSRSSRSCWPS